ncbi:MAG: DEAD/DEAH box helicase family protein [Alphaproteobacteria bacterium]
MVDQVLKNLMLDKLEAYVHSGVHGLRDHQVEAVLSSDAADMNNMVRFLRQPNQPREEGALVQPKQFDGGSTQMATGTGKTHVELETAVGMCQPTREDPQGQRAIIVSPRIAINSHISRTYVSPQGLHCSQDDIGIYDSSRSVAEQQHALRARYLVTTRAGFESLHDKGLISSDPKNGHYRPLVILDESDTFLGYESGRILRGEAGLSRHDIETTDLKDLPGYVQNSIVPGIHRNGLRGESPSLRRPADDPFVPAGPCGEAWQARARYQCREFPGQARGCGCRGLRPPAMGEASPPAQFTGRFGTGRSGIDTRGGTLCDGQCGDPRNDPLPLPACR